MLEKENPAPLAGGNRAVTLHVDRTVDSRKILRHQAARRLRRQELARQLHQLGARTVFEFVDEIARAHDVGDDLDRRLERYAGRLDPELLRATGGDRFPAAALRIVGGAQ